MGDGAVRRIPGSFPRTRFLQAIHVRKGQRITPRPWPNVCNKSTRPPKGKPARSKEALPFAVSLGAASLLVGCPKCQRRTSSRRQLQDRFCRSIPRSPLSSIVVRLPGRGSLGEWPDASAIPCKETASTARRSGSGPATNAESQAVGKRGVPKVERGSPALVRSNIANRISWHMSRSGRDYVLRSLAGSRHRICGKAGAHSRCLLTQNTPPLKEGGVLSKTLLTGRRA